MSETELKFAKRAIAQIALMGGEHTQQVLAYIKLFSAPENPLSLEQTYEILLTVADFWATYPTEAWQIAIAHLLEQKQSGNLKTPLINHNLLIDMMETIANFEPDDKTPINTAPPPPPPIAPPKSPDPPPAQAQRPSPTDEQKEQRHQQAASLMRMLESKKLLKPI